MKKILSIALVALLAASAVFAGITGKASFAAGYDLDDNLFSLSNSKTPDSTFSFEFDASTGETAAVEGGVYAEFKGSVTANMTEDGLAVKADLEDALIKSTDGLWSVNLTKVPNGVEVKFADFAADVYYKDKLNWGASFTTPEYAIIEGLTVSANVGYDEALNDFTDSANWSDELVKKEIAKEIAKAEAKYFAKHADGTYENGTLAGKQDAIAEAKKALKNAKAAFAKEQTEDNYKAIADAEEKLTKAETDLEDAIAAEKDAFMKANPTWYEATTTYKFSEVYEAYDATKTDDALGGKGTVVKHGDTVKGETYYLVGDDNRIVKASDYNLDDAKVKFTFTAPGTHSYVYQVRRSVPTTTYSLKAEHYDFKKTVADKKTVAGGLKVAYTKDLFAASVAGNVKYETVAKKVGFDVTANASYDFVKGGVSFERTLKAENLLGANVEATYAGVTVKASASDLLEQGEDGRLVSAEVGGSVAGVTAKVSGEYKFGNDYSKTGVGSFTMAGEVGYAFDFVAISAKLAGGSEYKIVDHDYKTAKVYVAPELTLTNKTLVQNAELSLAWTGAKFGGTDPKKGAVTAKVSVAF